MERTGKAGFGPAAHGAVVRRDPEPPEPACTPGHYTAAGGENFGMQAEDNQDRDCLTIRQVDGGYDDSIHVCDWPALKAAVDKHQRERGGRT